MRWDRLAMRGLGPFAAETSVDLSAIDGTLVAVTGPNGAGKSTALELLAGALFRRTPTRGSLADLATARDAYVEVDVVNGQRWRIRQTVDAKNGKGEAVVLDESGQPVLPSGKVREADAWVAAHLPTPEVLYTSVFAPQGSGGFLELKPGDRKAVLLRVLGIERLEALAEAARERGRAARGRADVLAARIADERDRGGDVDEAERELAAARKRVGQAQRDLASVRAELVELEELAQQAREAEREEADRRGQLLELQLKRDEARAIARDLETRVANNRRVLEEAATIRAAAARLEQLQASRAATREQVATVAAELDGLRRRTEEARKAGRSALAEADRASDEAFSVDGRLLELQDRIAEAEEAIDGRRETLRRAETRLADAETDLERLRGLRVAGAEQRIVDLRLAHELVRDGAEHPEAVAAAALDLDDQRVVLAKKQPEQTAEASAVVEERRRASEKARQQLAEAEQAVAQRSTLEAMRAAKEAAERRYGEATARVEEAAEAEHEAEEAAKAAERRLDELHHRTQAETAELVELELVARRASALDNALARLEELEPQLETTAATIEAVSRELRDLEQARPPDYAPPPVPDLDRARRRLDAAQAEHASTSAAVSVLEVRVATARDAAQRLEDLEAEQRQVDEEVADWRRLADDLGRDGLQALEIDAAGPELTELVNDLLRSCVGSRWTVSIETSRLSADGKRQLEGCEVRVLDAERGRDGTAESLSGGERVLVGEAISLALSMLACRRAGVRGPTLVRDESGAALDPVAGRAYVAMLRRAAEIVGASHVLYVSHSQELHELADARIVVRDGRLEVQ